MKRIIVSLGLILAMMFSTSTPVSAFDYTTGFSINSITSSQGGSGNVGGQLTWLGTNRAEFDASINDYCPADGKGVVFKMRGVSSTGTEYTQVFDTRGCGQGPKSWTRLINPPGDAYLTRIEWDFCLSNNDGIALVGTCKTGQFPNVLLN